MCYSSPEVVTAPADLTLLGHGEVGRTLPLSQQEGDTALHEAVPHGHHRATKALLLYGADVVGLGVPRRKEG